MLSQDEAELKASKILGCWRDSQKKLTELGLLLHG
jgi:hypothetical protein